MRELIHALAVRLVVMRIRAKLGWDGSSKWGVPHGNAGR